MDDPARCLDSAPRAPARSVELRARFIKFAQGLLAGLVLVLAAAWLWRQLPAVQPRALLQALRDTAGWRVAASLLLTAVSFACLAQFEVLATRWAVPDRIPRRQAWCTGLLAHALANTLGFHLLTAGAVRWRAYSRRGLSLAEVARVVALVGACVGGGVLAFALCVLVAQQAAPAARAALALGAIVACALAWRVLRRRDSRERRGVAATIAAHAPGVALLGMVEMAAATGAAFVLLPPGLAAPAWFAFAFLGAMLAGLASHAPGGLGVFEAAMLAALAPAPATPVLAALLAYRALYNLVPFALAVLALAGLAWCRRGAQFERG